MRLERGSVNRWEDDLVDPFLAEVEDVATLVDGCVGAGEADLPPSLRTRLLAAARSVGRFDRFLDAATALLDLPAERVRDLLDGIDRRESWTQGLLEGVALYDLPKGPQNLNAITGLVRMPEGATFPVHQHVGQETVLVLAGSYVDETSGLVHRAGELIQLPEGTSHGFRVRPGPDLIYIAVVQGGITVNGDLFGPNDPRI